jgi:hypothetical protein
MTRAHLERRRKPAAAVSWHPPRRRSLPVLPAECRPSRRAVRTLIKGGVVLSFDRGVGDFDKADVLIEGSGSRQCGPTSARRRP